MPSIAQLKEINAKRAESRKKTKTVQNEKDKTPVECGCGSVYKKYIKVQHESTTKHIEWLETQNTVVTPEPEPEREPIPESDDDMETEQTDTYIDDLARAEAKITELCLCLNMINNRMKALYELVDVDRPMMEQSAKKMFDMFALVLQMKRLGEQLMIEYTSK
jgi:hypothetical protein